MKEFVPTYLYIKEHQITGLLYFGKTTKDPHTYLGSGKKWIRHIKKHGKDHVITLWARLFTSYNELTQFAITFSTENDIVKSKDWANLAPENGADGGPRENSPFKTLNKLPKPESQKQKISSTLKNRTGKNSNRAIPVQVKGIKFYSIIEAAKHFNVSDATIINWKKKGFTIYYPKN